MEEMLWEGWGIQVVTNGYRHFAPTISRMDGMRLMESDSRFARLLSGKILVRFLPATTNAHSN